MSDIHKQREKLKQLIGDKLPEIYSDTSSRWGMMSPQHMVEHLSLQFAFARGKIEIDIFDRDTAREYKRRILGGDWSFPRNLKVPGIPEDKPPELRFSSLDKAKEVLMREMELFFEHYRKNPDDKRTHPLLGPLNYREWLQFHLLHCSHHFEQFDLISRQDRS